jgi:hypothetical protein
MLAWLLHRRCHARCCLRPRGVGRHTSVTHLPVCLRLLSRDRHFPKIHNSRGYGSDSEHTLFTSLDSCTSSTNQKRYTTGRLTKPYPGGPMLSHSLSTMNQRQVQTIIIVDSSQYQFFTLIFQECFQKISLVEPTADKLKTNIKKIQIRDCLKFDPINHSV